MTSKENTPLKVTSEHIEQLIQSEHYFTAYDASHGDNFISVYNSKTDIDKGHESLKLLTVLRYGSQKWIYRNGKICVRKTRNLQL